MGRLLGNITQPALESRFLNLLVALEAVIDKDVHGDEVLLRGTLMGKIVASGKYRAYMQAAVASGGDFSTGADTFTLEDLTDRDLMKHVRVGDVITDSGGLALGTVASFIPATGVGTLTGNSANNLVSGGNDVIISVAVLSIAKVDVRILKSETSIEPDLDKAEPGYNEGHFNRSAVLGATDEAVTAMGAKDLGSDEIRLI